MKNYKVKIEVLMDIEAQNLDEVQDTINNAVYRMNNWKRPRLIKNGSAQVLTRDEEMELGAHIDEQWFVYDYNIKRKEYKWFRV